MTVKELIDQLQKYQQELPVKFEIVEDDNFYYDIHSSALVKDSEGEECVALYE